MSNYIIKSLTRIFVIACFVSSTLHAEVKINTGKKRKTTSTTKTIRIFEAKTGIPIGATTGGLKRFNIKGAGNKKFIALGNSNAKTKRTLKAINARQLPKAKTNTAYSFTLKSILRGGGLSSITSLFEERVNNNNQGEVVSGSGSIPPESISLFESYFGNTMNINNSGGGNNNYDPCDPAYIASGNSCRFGSCNNNNQSCRGAKVTFKNGVVDTVTAGTACCIAGAVSAFEHCGGGYNCAKRTPDPRCENFPGTPYGYDGHECGRSGFLCCSAQSLSLIHDGTGSIVGYNCGSCVDNTSAFHQPLPAPSDPSKVPPQNKFDCNPGFLKCGSTPQNPYGNGECGRKKGDTYQCKAPIEDGYNTQECCSGRSRITGTLTTTPGCIETGGHANGCSAICECY